jgi:hypothetical protein
MSKTKFLPKRQNRSSFDAGVEAITEKEDVEKLFISPLACREAER